VPCLPPGLLPPLLPLADFTRQRSARPAIDDGQVWFDVVPLAVPNGLMTGLVNGISVAGTLADWLSRAAGTGLDIEWKLVRGW
jgi:hypothetical protein